MLPVSLFCRNRFGRFELPLHALVRRGQGSFGIMLPFSVISCKMKKKQSITHIKQSG